MDNYHKRDLEIGDNTYHKPVLLNEVLEFLEIGQEDWIIDATIGDGGYDVEILKKGGRIIGLDVDPEALERAKHRFEELGFSEDQYQLIQGNFRDIENLMQTDTVTETKAVIFDLGVSSLQLETSERGFSFGKIGPLDMRMDPSLGVSAADLVNILTKEDLNELFQKLGEERLSGRFTEAIISTRLNKKFENTKELADLLEKVAGGKRKGKIHPATRVFQALRIAVNDELHALQEALPQALNLIKKNGILLIISFHSLEDRIVKNYFKEAANLGLGTILTKKPIQATAEEVERNPKSRSAKLRVLKKS